MTLFIVISFFVYILCGAGMAAKPMFFARSVSFASERIFAKVAYLNRQRFFDNFLPIRVGRIPRPVYSAFLTTEFFVRTTIMRFKRFLTVCADSIRDSFYSPLVKTRMFSLGNHFKVFNPIVGLVFIYMVNNLIRIKVSAQMFRHDITMFSGLLSAAKHAILARVYKNIAIAKGFAALPIIMFFSSLKCHVLPLFAVSNISIHNTNRLAT